MSLELLMLAFMVLPLFLSSFHQFECNIPFPLLLGLDDDGVNLLIPPSYEAETRLAY